MHKKTYSQSKVKIGAPPFVTVIFDRIKKFFGNLTFPSNSQITHPKYRPDIDGLRGIAILAVVGYHAFSAIMPGGFVGVDIFFVISGFLISANILENLNGGSFKFVEFYARRVRRIFPALILVLISCFFIGWLVLLPDEFQQLGKNMSAGAGFFSNFFYWRDAGYFDAATITKPLLHLWSLSIEEQFYIVWPLMLWLMWKKRSNLAVIITFVMIGSFMLNLYFVSHDTAVAFYSPLTRFWELLIGAALAYEHVFSANMITEFKYTIHHIWNKKAMRQSSKDRGKKPQPIRSMIGLMLIIVAILSFSKTAAFSGWWMLMPTLGTYLIISAGQKAFINRKILSQGYLIWFGLISFPLYLWHWPLLSFGHIIEGKNLTAGNRLFIVFISILFAWLTYRFIERPIRFGHHKKLKTFFLCVFMVDVLCLGYFVYDQDGFTSRRVFFVTETLASQSAREKKQKNQAELNKLTSIVTSLKAQNKEDIAAEYNRLTRAPDCFLGDEPFEAFRERAESCTRVDEQKKNILIIGDSIAAELYGSLSSAYPNINFLQITGAGCNFTHLYVSRDNDQIQRCAQLMNFGLSTLRDNQVDAVFIASLWGPNYSLITPTLEYIKSLGNNVVIFGPPLQYSSAPKDLLLRMPANTNYTTYVTSFIDQDQMKLNDSIKDYAQKLHISYVDRIRYFCGNGDCPIASADDELLLLDVHHLSPAGIHYFSSVLKDKAIVESILNSLNPLQLPAPR
jgi:peptidoglycan/LPS O-acetylase OafA/YrhL